MLNMTIADACCCAKALFMSLILLVAVTTAAAAVVVAAVPPAPASGGTLLKCRVNSTTDSGMATKVATGCSFCVTFRNHLDSTVLLMCGARLPPPLDLAEASSLSDADSPPEEAAGGAADSALLELDVTKLELLTAQRVAQRCQQACGGPSIPACAYNEVARHNITDATGYLIETVLLGNVTYYCCRGGDFCNTRLAVTAGAAAAAAASPASALDAADKRSCGPAAPNSLLLQVALALPLMLVLAPARSAPFER